MRMLRNATGSLWPQKPKWPLVRAAPGCSLPSSGFSRTLARFGVENLKAVEVHFDVVAVDDDFLIVPLAHRPQIAARGRGQAVQAAVELVVVQVGVLFGRIVEHLQSPSRRRPGHRRRAVPRIARPLLPPGGSLNSSRTTKLSYSSLVSRLPPRPALQRIAPSTTS